MQTIPISIQQGGQSIPLSVTGGGTNMNLTPEELRVLEAVSPTVDAERVEDGVEITVHDLRGTRTVELHDGERGPQGEPGERGETGDPGPQGEPGVPGKDGVSPTATVTQTATGATITVTDEHGTTTAEIPNGQDGAPGAPGAPGSPGAPGADGISPTISVTDITGGHRVTITDATGPHSFDVMDGAAGQTGPQGAPGQGVPTGGTAGQVLKKASGADYDTEWAAQELKATRVTSLSATSLAVGTVVDAVGIPEYVSDVSLYPEYGLTDTGWYVFARIAARAGVTVTAATTVAGADGYVAEVGADHVDVAVRFGVTAQAREVVVSWGGDAEADSFVFKATDLGVRNLDYRTTFYLYDLEPFCVWSYALTTDANFLADKNYYTEADGVYTLAEVTVGEAIPANTYYCHSGVKFTGMTRNVT